MYQVIGGNPQCLSTHGGAGYAIGQYWDGDIIVCPCGARIIDPPPTGYRYVTRRLRPFQWWNPWTWFATVEDMIPTWPYFIPRRDPLLYPISKPCHKRSLSPLDPKLEEDTNR